MLTRRRMRWLLAGSILELLAAVPSHVIVRERDDCSAPAGTFFGICCGISVMLLSFGPGVFFLFARRMDVLRRLVGGDAQPVAAICRRNRAGQRCPECGTIVPAGLEPAEEAQAR